MTMTSAQAGVYDFIVGFIQNIGYSPTVREICDGLDYASTATVHRHLRELKKKGHITWIDGCVRTLRIVKQPQASA